MTVRERIGVPAAFDTTALLAAMNADRRRDGLDWTQFAQQLWDQSADLNARRGDHPLCPGAVSRTGGRPTMSCQYAMFMLRWLGRPPEDFLIEPAIDVGDTSLPPCGPAHRLRFDLAALSVDLDAQRRDNGLTWAGLACELGCTPARLTGLRTAKHADISLVLQLTQRLRRPAAAYLRPASW